MKIVKVGPDHAEVKRVLQEVLRPYVSSLGRKDIEVSQLTEEFNSHADRPVSYRNAHLKALEKGAYVDCESFTRVSFDCSVDEAVLKRLATHLQDITGVCTEVVDGDLVFSDTTEMLAKLMQPAALKKRLQAKM